MKVLIISDTHGIHGQLTDKHLDGVDCVIHAGDASNYRAAYMNESEMRNFLSWFESIKVKTKIYVPGNHDSSIEEGLVTKENFNDLGIVLLNHEHFVLTSELKSYNLFGSPYTPTFGNWSFMKNRHKLEQVWKSIPEDTNILITHGPPKGILDLSKDRDGKLEFCGDKSLLNRVLEIKPDYHIFGHIHNFEDIKNSGEMKISNLNTRFINASCVTDRKFSHGLTSYGTIIEL